MILSDEVRKNSSIGATDLTQVWSTQYGMPAHISSECLPISAQNACLPAKPQSSPYPLCTKHIHLCVLCVFARHLQQFIVNSTLSITTKPQHLNSSTEALSLQGKTLRRFLLPLLAVFIMNLKHRVILRKHILYILSSVVNLTPNLREPHLAVRQ